MDVPLLEPGALLQVNRPASEVEGRHVPRPVGQPEDIPLRCAKNEVGVPVPGELDLGDPPPLPDGLTRQGPGQSLIDGTNLFLIGQRVVRFGPQKACAAPPGRTPCR